jgi:hypothetical protein
MSKADNRKANSEVLKDLGLEVIKLMITSDTLNPAQGNSTI